MGLSLTDLEMLDPAEAWIRRLLDLSPTSGDLAPLQILARVHLLQGDIPRARTASDSASSLYPDHPVSHELAAEVALHAGDAAAALAHLSRIPEAVRALQTGQADPRGEPPVLQREQQTLLGLAELRLGNGERGRELLDSVSAVLQAEVDGERRLRTVRRAALAGILATRGQTGSAQRHLQRAADEGFARVAWLETHPVFRSLRETSAFPELLARVEANRARLHDEVRRLEIELYPPGEDRLDPTSGAPGSDPGPSG